MPDGRLVNLYGRAVGRAEQVPKATRHDHLPGTKGYFNAAALHGGDDPLWVCEGAFDALALLAAGIPRVVAIYGVQGWCWPWARDVGALVFALDAYAAGAQQWQALARHAVLRGKQVAVLPPDAYGGCKDVSEAWAAGVLGLGGAGADGDGTRGHGRSQEPRRRGWSGSPSWSSTGVSHLWRQSAARGRARRRQEPQIRLAARASRARRAEGWD